MATPTPGRQGQVAATPPVSTPSFSISGHRVVPSPAQGFKRSPATSNTLYGHSFAVGYDSPSAAMALGMDGMSGSLGMGMSLGIGNLGEDEKKRRLEAVVGTLNKNKGRLSEPGIERLSRRLGLESLWEDHPSSGGNTRTLIIAGSALALDIDFANNVVKKVSLAFPDAPEIVTRHTEKAGDILLRDLECGPGEGQLTKMLDRFAANLERLAQLDKLSVIPGLNCHEAIAGIYESLEKLHFWEVARIKDREDMADKKQDYIERTAMCTKGGQPLMHTRDRLGMSLDYWQEKRRIQKLLKRDEPKTWSLLIECAPMLDLVYTPVRVSEKWISPAIKKDNPNPEDFLSLVGSDDSVLDWLEPDATLLPSTEPSQPSDTKFPDVMFLAKFDPPLITTYNVAMQIHQSINVPLEPFEASFIDELMFPRGPNEKHEPGEMRKIKHQKKVPIFSADGKTSTNTHANTLYIEKVEYGRTMEKIPFSHPRHLVENLPYLRQYAFLSTLLRNSFIAGTKPATTATNNFALEKNKKELYADIFSQESPSGDIDEIGIDVTFTINPFPRLQVAFPLNKRTAEVTVDIGVNGVVEVVSQNVLKKSKDLTEADLARMLEITEDLGIWVEFLRRRLS